MATVRQITVILSRHRGVDVTPYAAQLVREGMLPRRGEPIDERETAALLLAVFAASDPDRTIDELHDYIGKFENRPVIGPRFKKLKSGAHWNDLGELKGAVRDQLAIVRAEIAKRALETVEAQREGQSVAAACTKAVVGRTAAYAWRKDDGKFAEAWDEAVKRALDKSDTLLIFMLKARRPEKFKERSETTHKGKVTFRMEFGGE